MIFCLTLFITLATRCLNYIINVFNYINYSPESVCGCMLVSIKLISLWPVCEISQKLAIHSIITRLSGAFGLLLRVNPPPMCRDA